jgi:hypothetical protein
MRRAYVPSERSGKQKAPCMTSGAGGITKWGPALLPVPTSAVAAGMSASGQQGEASACCDPQARLRAGRTGSFSVSQQRGSRTNLRRRVPIHDHPSNAPSCRGTSHFHRTPACNAGARAIKPCHAPFPGSSSGVASGFPLPAGSGFLPTPAFRCHDALTIGESFKMKSRAMRDSLGRKAVDKCG